MANEVKIILTAVDKASAVLKKTGDSSKDLWKKIGSISGVAIAAGVAIKKIADDTVAYNKSIRELTQVTGTGAEEISRIVQVADDWGISIDQVRSALVLMNKNGMKPSIDNLAELADEYVNTADKTQFAEKANKLFGRQYATLIPLFAKGGKALRDQSAALDENLLATDDSIKAAREYEIALDNWNDKVLALKYSIGNQLLPELARMLEDINNLNDATAGGTYVGVGPQAAKKLREAAFEAGTLSSGIRDVYNATKDADMTGFESRLTDIAGAADEAAEKLKLIPVALQEVDKAQLASAAIDAVTKAFNDGLIPQSQYDELMRKIGDKFTDLTDDEINQQIQLAALARSYNEGRIPIEDYIKTLDALGYAWGKIPKDVTTTYHIKYDKAPYGSEPGPGVPVPGTPGWGDGKGNKKAMGGPVMAGQAYTVGERGPEMFVPNQSGTIIPNNQMGGMSVDITINAAPGMDVNAVANAVIQKLSIASRTRGAGGYARGA